MAEEKYDDFQVADDGFRDVSKSISGRLGIAEVDAEPGEMVNSNGDNTPLDKIGVLIVPQGAQLDKALALDAVEVVNLADVGHAIKTLESPVPMVFTDVKVLREFIRRHGLFGVRIAHLRNVPDVIKDRLYEQSVWDLTAVDYPILLERVRSLAEATAAKRRKDEVGKRMALRDKRRVTEEFEGGTSTPAMTASPDVEDEDQFEG